jgi:guanine deaminase
MNQNARPNYIELSVDEVVDSTLALFKRIEELPRISSCQRSLVQSSLTPRYAIPCTEELLTRLSEIAAESPQLAIHTHISEHKSGVELTKRIFNADSYTEVHEKYSLLHNNMILIRGLGVRKPNR